MNVNSFSKSERLCNKNITASLFKAGQSFLVHPCNIVWLVTELPENTPVQVLISVSKSKFPRAVDRNRIKRLIREAVRLHKSELYRYLIASNKQVAFAIIYTSKKITTFNEIEKKMTVALTMLKDKISENK